MRTFVPAALLGGILTASLALSGCSTAPAAESHSPVPGSSSSPVAGAQVIAITVKDGKATPSGATVEVKVGKPIELRVTADAPGELHIHTSPAHALNFTAGVSSLTLTLDHPGTVEAEIEDTGQLVVKLEAR